MRYIPSIVLSLLLIAHPGGLASGAARETESETGTDADAGPESDGQAKPRTPETEDGTVMVEAENFIRQVRDDTRRWLITRKGKPTPAEKLDLKDPDPSHVEGAGGDAYIEILPDTRVTEDDPLVRGESFSNEPGVLGVLAYRIRFKEPGRYYVWARAHSTGTDDNGVHVGLDGDWPESGQRIQWCKGKNKWTWSSAQRRPKNHCGEPRTIWLDVENAGVHLVTLSMREDGTELDQLLLTREKAFEPKEDLQTNK